MKALLLTLPLLAQPLLATASGGHGHAGHAHANAPSKAPRTLDIEMHDDMRFSPAYITVKTGETIRLRVRNAGSLPHEMVIGSGEALRDHAASMRDHAHTAHTAHNEPHMVQLAPGQRGELIWQAGDTDRIDFACLLPGHFEAGMRGQIRVR